MLCSSRKRFDIRNGPQLDASHSVSADGGNAAAVAGSVASVALRQLGDLAARNGGALVLVSLGPTAAAESGGGGKLELLRSLVHAKLEVGCYGFGNVGIVDVGSRIHKLGSSSEVYITETGHFSPTGIKKLVRVWSKKIGKILS